MFVAGQRLNDLSEDARIVVSVVGLDESYAQTIHARHVYAAQDVAWDVRFVDVVTRDQVGFLTSANLAPPGAEFSTRF